MKLQIFFLLAIAFVSKTSCLIAQEGVYDQGKGIITVEQYCTFLNEVAENQGVICSLMMRSGEPGSYRYEAMPGQENASISFISWNDAARYGDWKNSYFSCSCEAASIDHALKSNLLTFRLIDTGTKGYQAGGAEVGAMDTGVEEFFEVLAGLFFVEGVSGRVEGVREGELSDSQRATVLNTTSKEKPESNLSLIETVAERTSNLTKRTKSKQNYQQVDKLWNDRETAWQRHQQTYQELEQRKMEAILAKEVLEQATEANTDEAREQTRLGKLLKGLKQATETIGEIPLPPTQVAAAGMKGVAGMVEIAQKIWTKTTHFLAEQEHQKSLQCLERAQEKATQANVEIIAFEEEVKKQEEVCLEAEQSQTRKLAQCLRPHAGWGETAWREWGKELLSVLHPEKVVEEEELQKLLQVAPSHLEAITKLTAELWQQRIEQSKQALEKRESESAKKIARLQHAYNQQKKKVEQVTEATSKSYQQLTIARQRKEKLKQDIEEFLENQREEKRQKFCDDFKNLIETQQEVEQLQTHWEKKLQEDNGLRSLVSKALASLEAEKKQCARLYDRAKAALKVDRELLRLYWPDYDVTYRPYLSWQLPFQEENEIKEKVSIEEHAQKNSFSKKKNIEPPLISQEELEARGKRYHFEQEQRIAAVLAELEQQPASSQKRTKNAPLLSEDTLTEVTEVSDSSLEAQEENSLILEQKETTDLLQELLAWSRAHATIADKQRWKIFTRLQQAEKESRDIATRLQQARKEEELETGSVISSAFRGNGKKASKAASIFGGALSIISGSTAKTAVTKEESSVFSLGEQLQRAQKEEERVLNQYLQYVQEAEKRRLDRGNKTLLSDKLMVDLWRDVDEALSQEKKAQEEILAEKRNTTLFNPYERWEKNVLRWNARKKADQAERAYPEKRKVIEDELVNLAMQSEIDLITKKDKRNRLQEELTKVEAYPKECERDWETLAQAHRSIQDLEGDNLSTELVEKEKKASLGKAVLKLKESDQAVLERWYQLEDRLKREKGEEALDPEQAAMEKNPASFETLLTQALEQHQEKAFNNIPYLEVGIRKYHQAVQEEALQTARENKSGAAKGWERRVSSEKERLLKNEQAVNDPKVPHKMRLELSDFLPKQRRMLETEQKGEKIFKKEKERLDRIEQLWRSLLEAERIERLQRAATAATAYEQGTHVLWEQLSPEERDEYNQDIELKDNHYRQTIADEERELEEIGKTLTMEKAKIEKVTKRSFFRANQSVDQGTLDLLTAAETHYQKRIEALTKSKAVLELGKMSDKEREDHTLKSIHEKIIEEAGRKKRRALEKKGQAEATKEEKVAKVWEEAAKAYQEAEEAGAPENFDAVRCYYQSAAAFETQVKAFIDKDEVEAARQEKIAEAWKEAAWAYEKTKKEEALGNLDAARCLYQRAVACESQARAFIDKDEMEATRQGEIKLTWFSANLSYTRDKEVELAENCDEDRCWHQRGVACEVQARALMDKEEAEAVKQEKIAEAWRRAAWAYRWAKEADIVGNHDAARCYRHCAAVFETQVKAFIDKDEEEAIKQEKAAKAWEEAVCAYQEGEKTEAKESLDAVRCYHQRAAAYESQARAFIDKDEVEAARQEKIAGAWRRSAWAYEKTKEAGISKNPDAVRCYHQRIVAIESQVRALINKDEEEAARQEKIAGAWKEAAGAYQESKKAGVSKNRDAVRCYHQRAVAYESQARAFMDKEEVEAARQEKIAEAWKEPACAYQEGKKAGVSKNRDAVRCYHQRAVAIESQARAFIDKDEVEAARQEKIAGVWKKAALAYERTKEADALANSGAVRCYHQRAVAIESQARALIDKDEVEAAKQEKIAGAWKEAAWAYEEAKTAGILKNRDAVHCYHQRAVAFESQARALIDKDEEEAARQEKIAGAWKEAAWAYGWAKEADAKGNHDTARCYHQRAVAIESQARALIDKDEVEAARQKKIAEAWGSAANAYREAKEADAEKNHDAARCWHQCTIATESQVRAFIDKDEVEAASQEKIAETWEKAAKAYKKAKEAEALGNLDAAGCLYQRAAASEAQVKALINKDEVEAGRQEKIAAVWQHIVLAYASAQYIETQVEARAEEIYDAVFCDAVRDAVRCLHQRAAASEAQVNALMDKNEVEATTQQAIAEAWGYNDGEDLGEGAVHYYLHAADAEDHGDHTSANRYREIAAKYETYAMALINREPEEELKRRREELEEISKNEKN